MAVVRVQHVESAVTSDASGNAPVTFASTAVANNLIVLWANSDATVALAGATSGYTNAVTDINGNGAYVWYKVAAGTETAATFITGVVSEPICCGMIEYSAITSASPLDIAVKAFISDAGAITCPSLTGTLTTTDLIVAFANLHGMGGGTATAPVWTGTITNFVNVATGGTTARDCQSFVGDLLSAAAGSFTTQNSYTAGGGTTGHDRETNFVAFKLASGQVNAGPTAGTGAGLAAALTIAPPAARPAGTGATSNATVNTGGNFVTAPSGLVSGTGADNAPKPSVFVTAGWSRIVVTAAGLKDGSEFMLKTGEPLALKAS